jgi:hypothetical protein
MNHGKCHNYGLPFPMDVDQTSGSAIPPENQRIGPPRTGRMRYTLTILGLAVLITGVASLAHNSSHGLGTGANSTDFKSFGWPVEVWSRTEHIYQTVTFSPGQRKIETVHYPTRYSVTWMNAGMIFAGAVAVSYVLALCIFRIAAPSLPHGR